MGVFRNEAEVGAVVKSYLLDMHQEVYCEVETDIGRIDIVAVSPTGMITSVELKACLSMDVLGQAIYRSRFVHRSVAAFPMPKDSRHYKLSVLRAIHLSTGIGIWLVDKSGVKEEHAPRIQRNPRHIEKWVRGCLREEQKHQDAGVNRGYWSPFQQTKKTLVDYVRNNEGCTLKDAMNEIQHHYATHSSAYNSMGTMILQGVVKEIERRDGGLFPRSIEHATTPDTT